MAVYTCTRDDARATLEVVMTPSGERPAIICPTHGIIAYEGFKPTGGAAGMRAADGNRNLAAGEYSLITGGNWIIRPPRGPQSLLRGMTVVVNPDLTITVTEFIDGGSWKGWLEAGVWIEEER